MLVAATGTVTIKWKASKSTPITPTSSTLDIIGVNGTIFNAGTPVNSSLAGYILQHANVTGAFTAGGFSTQPFLTLISSQDTGAVGFACVGAGVKKLNIGLGKFSTS